MRICGRALQVKVRRDAFCWAGLILVMTAAVSLAAGDNPLKQQLQELNKITGEDVVEGKSQLLIADPSAGKLIEYAHETLEKDDKALTYNAAYILAEVARRKGEAEASEAFYKVCTKIAAELESTQKLLQAYGGLIELLYENKEYKKSAKVCKELLELETGPGKPRVVLVLFKFAGELRFIPMDDFDSAKRLQGGVQRLLVQALAKQGKFDQALKMAQQLVAENNHWLRRDILAWVYRESSRFTEAAQEYEAILQQVMNDNSLEPKERQDYVDRYRYILSNVYVELNQVKKATEQLKALVKQHPDEPGYYNDLGYIMADHGINLPEAEKLIRKAIKLDRKQRKEDPNLAPEQDRDNGAYLDSLGWALYKQQKYKEAKKYLLQAIEDKRTQHIEIYDHLGDVLIELGEREAALEAWRKGADLAGPSRRDQERKASVLKKIKLHSKEVKDKNAE